MLYTTTIMISITTVLQIHIQIQADSVVQIRTVLLTSVFGSSTRGERHNSYNADHSIRPQKCAAHPVMFKISVGRNPKNPTTSSMVKIQLSTSKSMAGTQLSACMVQCQLSTDLFLKSSNSQPISSGHPHSSPISCLGFIMTIVIVISFVHEHKTVPNDCTWTKSRIVQSPTKLNNKI